MLFYFQFVSAVNNESDNINIRDHSLLAVQTPNQIFNDYVDMNNQEERSILQGNSYSFPVDSMNDFNPNTFISYPLNAISGSEQENARPQELTKEINFNECIDEVFLCIFLISTFAWIHHLCRKLRCTIFWWEHFPLPISIFIKFL